MPTNINSLSITSDIIFQNQGVTLDPPFEGQIKIYAKSDNKLYFRAGPNGAEAPLGLNTGDSFNWTGTNTFTNTSTVNFNGYVNVYGGLFNYTSNYNLTNGYGFNIGGLQKNTALVYGVVSLWGVTANTWFMPTTNVTNVASISATNYFTPAYTRTITNAIGYYADLRADLSDGGSVTNLYGLYIAPMSTATNNYSAYFGNSVGIGTANPSTLLHVSSADTQTEITIESTVAASRSTLKLLTNGNDWEVGARGSSLAPNNAFYIYDLTANAYRAVIDSSGAVGIGTTTPGALFDVYGGNIRADAGGANNLVLRDGSIENHKVATDAGAILVNYAGYNSGTTYFRDFDIANGKNVVFARFQGSTSRLGIGTTSPSTTLHVVGNTTLNGDITHSGTGKRFYANWSGSPQSDRLTLVTSTANGLTLIEVTPNGTAQQSGINFCNTSDSLNASVFQFMSDPVSGYIAATKRGTGSFLPMRFLTSDVDRMTITAAGNVGIGTTSPGAKLDVAGTLRLNGTTAGTNYTEIKSAAAPASNITYTLPASAPAAGQYLQSDASGNLTWATISTASLAANYARSFLLMGA